MIPKLIHFVWIGGAMPGWAERNLDEFRRLNPGYEVRIHGAEALLECYREHYAAAGELCSKADLLRYSVLERYGGWYFDCDYWPFRPVADAQRAWALDGRTVFVAECWTSRSNPGWLGNGMLASVPGHHVWAEVRAAVAAVKVGTTDRLAFGPTLIRGVLERDPNAFTLASEPWFNGVKAPISTKLYRHIRRTGDTAFARAALPRTGGQLPFAMHLWAWKHGAALDGPVPSQALGIVGRDNPRSAVVVTMPNGRADKGSVFTAVAEGLAGLGFCVEVLPYEARTLDRCGEIPEVVVLWNGMREQGAAILAQARQFGATVLRLEYGFFDRSRYFQIDHEGILHWASWRRQLRSPAPESGASRLARFCPAGLAEGGPRSGYVLVLGQVPGDTQVNTSEIKGPIPLQEAIARNLPRGMSVPVYFRPHPSVSNPAPNPCHKLLPRLPDQPDERQAYRGAMQSASLADALRGALFVVTINSNAAVEALTAGVPVLAFGPHLGIGAGVIRRTTQATFPRDFEAMLSGWRPDPAAVRSFLEWLAARQWSREELSRPETLRPLLEAAGVRLSEAATAEAVASLPAFAT